ncbi:hypothetical protein LguiA_014516 [Lonicera macranthoides]
MTQMNSKGWSSGEVDLGLTARLQRWSVRGPEISQTEGADTPTQMKTRYKSGSTWKQKMAREECTYLRTRFPSITPSVKFRLMAFSLIVKRMNFIIKFDGDHLYNEYLISIKFHQKL